MSRLPPIGFDALHPQPIPDGIEPIIGYRAWKLNEKPTQIFIPKITEKAICFGPDNVPKNVEVPLEVQTVPYWKACNDYSLYSSAKNFVWPYSGPLRKAICIGGPVTEQEVEGLGPEDHIVPEPECRCGYYAYKDAFRALLVWNLSRWDNPELNFVIGSVEMWGRIQEHNLGYRSEFARIKAIDSRSRAAAQVANLYRVPCEKVFPIPSSLEGQYEPIISPWNNVGFTPREPPIPYNFLIDAQGKVYEGRAVVGTKTEGYKTQRIKDIVNQFLKFEGES